jgi:uncharacterized membrane protein
MMVRYTVLVKPPIFFAANAIVSGDYMTMQTRCRILLWYGYLGWLLGGVIAIGGLFELVSVYGMNRYWEP